MAMKATSVDGVLASVKATQNQSRELIAQYEQSRKAMDEMREQSGMNKEVLQKIMNSLSPSDQKIVAEEEEKFARELQQDLDAALHRAALDNKEGETKKPKARKYL